MWTLKCTKRSEKQIEFTLANCMPNRKKTKPLLCYPCLSNQSATSFPGSSHLTALWGASEVGSKMINPQLCTRQRDQIKRQKSTVLYSADRQNNLSGRDSSSIFFYIKVKSKLSWFGLFPIENSWSWCSREINVYCINTFLHLFQYFMNTIDFGCQ